jgi:CubicO group peptidase (beta-lactamase class C family)
MALTLLLASCGQPVASPTPTEVVPEPTSTTEPTLEPTTTAEPGPEPTTTERTATEAPDGEEGPATTVLEPFTNDAMGISGVAPEGWAEAAPGTYARGANATDPTVLIQKSYPGTTLDQINAALLPQLGLEELPESVGSRESAAFTWDLYTVEVEAPGVGMFTVEIAQSETDAAAYMVLLQALADDFDMNSYREAIFLPTVDALAALSGETAEAGVYEDPDGLFSVPIPTNWTAVQADGYAILSSPDNEITLRILAIEGDDVEEAIKAAWAVVDPEFDLEPEEISERPPPAGVENYIVVTYDTGDENELLWASGRLHEGLVYTFLGQADEAAYEKRLSQLAIIGTGLSIKAIEITDLTGVEPLPLTDELIAELEDFVVDQMELLDVPGAAVAIVQGDEIVYAKGFGVREHGKDDPVMPETLMRIGSTTKPMTTMMMATLVDEGLMDWDTPVIDILPTFKVADSEITQRITVRNLVCACTGVPRRDAELRFNAYSAEGIIESLADIEFFTEFGEAFQYSNQMVATGGYVAALAAGGQYGALTDSYVALMQERILDPIGMTSSVFAFEEAQAGDNYVTPHGMNLAGEYVPIPYSLELYPHPSIAPSGALSSNVLDMGRYLITLLNEGVAPDGTRVVSAENLAATWEPQVAISADESYGLGWVVSEYKGLQTLSHAGNTLGCTSHLAFLPEADLGISVLTNQRMSHLNELVGDRLLELLYQQEPEAEEAVQDLLERMEEALAKVREQLADSADPNAVAPYLGKYTNDALGEIVVRFEEGSLTLDAGEFVVELLPRVGEDGEVIAYTSVTTGLGGEFQFSVDDDGNPAIVNGSPPREYRFEKVE